MRARVACNFRRDECIGARARESSNLIKARARYIDVCGASVLCDHPRARGELIPRVKFGNEI